jgi:CheY-like chemotaxis protein
LNPNPGKEAGSSSPYPHQIINAMGNDIRILIAEDDEGHASLIQRNLRRAGIINEIEHFRNGEEVMEYLFANFNELEEEGLPLLLLLDIRMPKMDGIEVLRKIKEDRLLKKMPVTMLTTTDDPVQIDLCHELGCSHYISKPVDYEDFIKVIRQLGLFLKVVSLPRIRIPS